MIYRIGDGAVSIALFQTVPGKEASVQGELVRVCRNKHIKKFAFFKALGSFDIIMFYLTHEDFASFLPAVRSLSGILKSTVLYCYSYSDNSPDGFFDKIATSNFAGLSLLKISPEAMKEGSWLLKTFRKYVLQGDADRLLLGSIGWSEMILVLAREDMVALAEELLNTATSYMTQSRVPVLIKTFSVIGINYKYLPPRSLVRTSFKRVLQHMNLIRFMEKTVIEPSDSKVFPLIEVSNEPMYTSSIRSYFRNRKFLPYDLCGKQDMCFIPSEQMTWGELVSSVIYFRNRFGGQVFSTNIRLRLNALDPIKGRLKKLATKPKPLEFPDTDLRKKLGEEMASSLANHFYSFNSLLQNPIYGTAFADMAQYPEYVVQKGLSLTQRPLEFIHGAREVLRYGSELRSYGTFETIEEVTGKFSELRGGGQRALLALEYLPNRILANLNITWKGFVISSHTNRFLHINEVIQVPTDALWKPQRWWALYHEIAHIFIDHHRDWVNYDSGPLREFIAEKKNREAWIKLTMEIAAEIIGFELGFFGKYDLFFRRFWEHVTAIDANVFAVEHYAVRSFFLKLYLACFTSIQGVPHVEEKSFLSLDFVYNEFMKHLELVEQALSHHRIQLSTKKYVLAAENTKTVVELYYFAKELSDKITTANLRPAGEHLSSKNTEHVLTSLSQGRPWWGPVSCPQAVLHNIFNGSEPRFSTQMAIVVTFWYHQMRFMQGQKTRKRK